MSLPSTSARGTLAARAWLRGCLAGCQRRQRRAGRVATGIRHRRGRPAMGHQCLHAGLRRAAAHQRRARGPAGRAAHLPGGLPGVHRGLGRVRPERQLEDADRRPPGPRAGGGIAGAELAGHVAAGLSRSRAAQPRGGLVGRIWRRVAGRRPGAGRNAGDAYGLAQHFSHQSAHWPDRNPSDAASRGGAWRGSARPGLGGAGRGHPGIGRAYHGPDRSRPARLDARPGARRLVGGGRRHPGLHLDRGSRAFAHAAAGIVQGLDLRGGLPGWRDRELRLLRLDLRVQPVLPGATAALAATDGIGLPAHDHRADGRQCVGGTPDHAPGRPRADGPGAGPGGGRLWLADAGQRGRQLLAAGRADADGGQRHRPDGADHDQRHAVIGGRLPGGHCLGVLNSARQVGGMLGVAVFGYLLRDTEPQAFMRGMHLSIGIAVALLLAASALCWFRLGTERAVA